MGNANVKPHPKPRNKKQVRWKAADRPSPPGKPTLVQENDITPDVVHICWPKPVKDGGSPITSYLVEHKRLGTPHWVKASTQPVLTPELIVNGLEPGWRYQFRVRAENVVGHSDPSEASEPFTVTLQRSAITAPKFTQELKDTVVLENSKAEFEVHFLGQPTPTICWFKDGFEIFSSNRTRITTLSDKTVLTVLQSTGADEGEIKCTATNRAGHASTKAKFTIEAPPSIRLPKSYQDQDGIIFEIGETIRLNVSVAGRPTPLVFWSHDGESIQNDDRHELEYIDKTATVKIENALRADRGEYQLRAVNKLGQDVASFLVTITDKPTPPGKARVLLTSGKSVTLSWSTPEDDGGCKIGNYIIEYYRVGWNVWLKAATSRQLSTMLGDLIEGSQYKFRVKAESPYGVSDPSEESETVFIPDHKRGINNPTDVIRRIENQPPLPVDVIRRRRASSSPRVSFAINEGVPIRPERKKTGKTPEASPRMKRKQIIPPPDQKNDFSLSNYEKSQLTTGTAPSHTGVKFDRRSPTILKPEPQKSPAGSPSSPLKRQLAFSFPEITKQNSTTKFSRENTKSPSPEIIITDTGSYNEKNLIAKPGTEKSPTRRRRSFSEGSSRENSKSVSPTSVETEKLSNTKRTTPTPKNDDRMRPPLTRGDFSGSSEFMLVLCPEGEQGAQFKKLGISFEEHSVPPPLSLSAPELGGPDPPEPPTLKRSASSTELLNYRLMERLNDAILQEEERAEMKRNEEIERRVSLDIPLIQVNSKPTQELVGLERKPSLNRRLSAGVVLKHQPKFSQRRQSLRNASEMNSLLESKLHKFHETVESKRELMEYRQEKEEEERKSYNEERKKSLSNDEDWMKDYEESIPSDEETESSIDERRNSYTSPPHYSDEDDDQETYNPRSRMITAVRADTDKPFEILTVRREPPDSNIVPKPILKKNTVDNIKLTKPPLYYENSHNEPVFRRNRSHSLIDSSDDSGISSLFANRKGEQIYQRDRSNSLIAYNEEIDVNQIKRSPNNMKRRSFSLIPSQANFLKDALKNKNKKEASPTPPIPVKPSKNVSALASFTSIAGAGLVIPEKMMNKKEAEEESKVIVDFYGDIVKSFGGKSKPTAEFSRTIVSKYDTYEERKIAEIKPNVETAPQETYRAAFESIPPNKLPSSPKKIERQDTARDSYTPQFSQIDRSTMNESVQQKFSETKSASPSSHDDKTRNISLYSENKDNLFSENRNIRSYRENNNIQTYSRTPSKSPIRPPSIQGRNTNKMNRSPSPRNQSYGGRPHTTERPQSRSTSITRRRKPPRSRDASTSPVRFENWESRSSSRNSLERDYYSNRGSLSSSRASSLTRRSPSPARPKLREITTQTSFRIEPRAPADIIKKQEELALKAERRVKGVFEYFTDLAMVAVACWLYLFQNEYLAIPILLILVYRQLSEEITKLGQGFKKRIPKWIMKRFRQKDDGV